jgi:poly(3-hydroxyoctanoate) depolymerase
VRAVGSGRGSPFHSLSLALPVSVPQQFLFLPGASGNIEFWRPVAELLGRPVEQMHYIGWPGFGPTPPDPEVTSLGKLVRLVAGRIQGPTALIAQSMGGVVALLAALEKPALVTHLVLDQDLSSLLPTLRVPLPA